MCACLPTALIIAFGGVAVLYAIGSAWVSVVAGLGYPQALAANAPFIPGDLIKVAVATAVAMTVRRAYPLMAAGRA